MYILEIVMHFVSKGAVSVERLSRPITAGNCYTMIRQMEFIRNDLICAKDAAVTKAEKRRGSKPLNGSSARSDSSDDCKNRTLSKTLGFSSSCGNG